MADLAPDIGEPAFDHQGEPAAVPDHARTGHQQEAAEPAQADPLLARLDAETKAG